MTNKIARYTLLFYKTTACYIFYLDFKFYSPINTANIRNATEQTNKINWNNIVFLNHSAKLTSARPKPTNKVPQVGYRTLVYPSAKR